MTGAEGRHRAVGLSVEAEAGAWARQDGAPHGSVLRLDQEIAGRLRGGAPAPNGPALAAVVRCNLAVEDEDRLWTAAVVGALASLLPTTAAPALLAGWPDTIVADSHSIAFVTLTTQALMGQIVLTIITLRSLDANHLPAPEVFATAVCRAALAAQEDYEPLAKEWADTSALTGHPVVVALLPRGETRGTVTGLAPDGRLRLVSATGMVELLAVGAVRNVNLA